MWADVIIRDRQGSRCWEGQDNQPFSFSFMVLYDEGLYDDVGLKSLCARMSG